MHAEVGDEIVVRGRHVGDEDRKGLIIEVHGEGGAPPSLNASFARQPPGS